MFWLKRRERRETICAECRWIRHVTDRTINECGHPKLRLRNWVTGEYTMRWCENINQYGDCRQYEQIEGAEAKKADGASEVKRR